MKKGETENKMKRAARPESTHVAVVYLALEQVVLTP